MQNNTYTAITIGPIYKTFNQAKRTRAVWAASYFFSYISRRILEDAVNSGLNIFLPDISMMTEENKKKVGLKGKFGAGLYADRLYFINDPLTNKEKLKTIVEKVLNEVVSQSGNGISNDFLNDYMNIHIIEKTIEEHELKDNEFPLKILNQTLDNWELFQNFNFNYEKNPLQQLFNSKAAESFLSKDAFGSSNRVFKSISEIATTSFERDNKVKEQYANTVKKDLRSKEETDLIDELIKNNIPIRPRHKYFAVIYADGDNIGKVLSEINQKGIDLKEFSKCLFEFGIKAEETVYRYGGTGIYLGGEDVLVFAPITCLDIDDQQKQNTVFQLIQQLDKNFEDTVRKFSKDNQITMPTLSFGIMISYYKHPLKEAMTEAYRQLNEVAKNKNTKNNIALRIQKHSGQYFDACVMKSFGNSLKGLYSLIDYHCKTPKNKKNDSDEILRSITQKFRDSIFVLLLKKAVSEGTTDAFIKNFFNENIHTGISPKATFLKEIRDLATQILNEYDDKDEAVEVLITILQFILLVNSQRDN